MQGLCKKGFLAFFLFFFFIPFVFSIPSVKLNSINNQSDISSVILNSPTLTLGGFCPEGFVLQNISGNQCINISTINTTGVITPYNDTWINTTIDNKITNYNITIWTYFEDWINSLTTSIWDAIQGNITLVNDSWKANASEQLDLINGKASYQFDGNNFNGTGNITANNINATGYLYGKPIMGMLGSGLIGSVQGTGTKVKDINVTCTGLVCTYNSFEMRITSGDVSTSAKYCNISNGTLNVPDNTNAMYYIDSNCAVQQTTYSTWFTTTMGNGGAWDFANILTHSGSAEVIDTISLEERRLMKARLLNYYEWQGKVLEGFNFQQSVWNQFNITSGKYVYGMDAVDVDQHNVSASDEIELVGHNSSSTWYYTDQTGLNVTHCDNGTAIVACTGANYRRHFIFMIGYDTATSESEVHQLFPLASRDYSTVAQCLDTTTNPLTYTLPQEYTGATVMLYAYCAKRTDSSWTSTNLIDLRTIKTGVAGSSGSGDTSGLVPYTGATQNVNLGVYNITVPFVCFNTACSIKTNGTDLWV